MKYYSIISKTDEKVKYIVSIKSNGQWKVEYHYNLFTKIWTTFYINLTVSKKYFKIINIYYGLDQVLIEYPDLMMI